MRLYEVYIRLCNEKGITPSAAALEMGLSKAMVSRWKKGSNPSDATIIKVADYFGLKPKDLYAMTEENKKPAAVNDRLSEREEQIIMMLRDAPPELRSAAYAAALAVLRSQESPS